MTDVFICKWIFNSDPDGQEKICFLFIQGWSQVTSFETLLTSCDSQIILSLGSTTYYVETKYAKSKGKKYFEIDVLVQLIVRRPPRSVCNSHRSLRSYILHLLPLLCPFEPVQLLIQLQTLLKHFQPELLPPLVNIVGTDHSVQYILLEFLGLISRSAGRCKTPKTNETYFF